MYKILTLNLGVTSTKLNLYYDEILQKEITIRHSDEELGNKPLQGQQLELRYNVVNVALKDNNIDINEVDAIVIRVTGATYKMTKSGTYMIADELEEYLMKFFNTSEPCRHPANITLPLAKALIADREIPVFLVDPTTVDEFEDIARITGFPEIQRASNFHALNQKAAARNAAKELGKRYDETKLVVAHLGGGVSIGAHLYGRVVDSCNGGGGQDGPFTPNRSGKLPLVPLVTMCYSGEYSREEMYEKIIAKGGFAAHLGLTDIREVVKNAENGDEKADLLLDAFVYQVCKEIGAQYSVLGFEADGIVLTGGLAYSERIVNGIRAKVDKLGQVFVYPGEDEGPSMALGALRVLRGEEKPITMEDLK